MIIRPTEHEDLRVLVTELHLRPDTEVSSLVQRLGMTEERIKQVAAEFPTMFEVTRWMDDDDDDPVLLKLSAEGRKLGDTLVEQDKRSPWTSINAADQPL